MCSVAEKVHYYLIVFTQISATALIKFFMPQMRHLFEGGFCLDVESITFFRTKVTELNLIFSGGYLLTCSKCGAYFSKYGILTSWGKEFVLTLINRF